MQKLIREITINLNEAMYLLSKLRVNKKLYREDYGYFRAAITALQCAINVANLKELREVRLDIKNVRGHLKYVAEKVLFKNSSLDNFSTAYNLVDKCIEDIEHYFSELAEKEIA